ncbi:Drug resistance transporter Bcr/CflA subfamily [Cupriavidus taiwanensis]|uniref:Bcr/CflA family efflux transporter n=1 Tax=Cupriavidus taiwanensis TaxID=164546 RepID=A0A375IEF5_9BURK|nr:multidrug effflux MFS transporter [Cupriavidus taiwanensis]SPK72450.1 Drug resistance transporter Bcr/CflA subfamily [Cupriavidus taiwanensis]
MNLISPEMPAQVPATTRTGPRFTILVGGLVMLGQFAIGTYLPAFDTLGAALSASPAEVQQSLTAYMLPFGLMMLWHGAISDAIGRRRSVLAGLALFALGSLVCAAASQIETLYAGRFLQGLSAGVGAVVGRAMVRDVASGATAQRQLALVGMLFALAPALAPVCGGLLLAWAGWRSIFLFLALLSAGLLWTCWLWLPETLPPPARHALRPVRLARAYRDVLSNPGFVLLALANAGVNMAIYVYVLGAPSFVTQHLGLNPQSFAWLFVPIVTGLLLGSLTLFGVAGRVSPGKTIAGGHVLMFAAAVVNLSLAMSHAPALPWIVMALPCFAFGMMLTQPSLQLLALDCAPERRGLAASCYLTFQQVGNALLSALVMPLLSVSITRMALGMLAIQCIGALLACLALRSMDQSQPLGGDRPVIPTPPFNP